MIPKQARDVPRVVIQPQDIEMFQLLRQHRVLSTEHLRRLTSRELRSLQIRLRKLRLNGFVDQLPRATLENVSREYALGNAGARVLADQQGVPLGKRVDWSAKNRSLTPRFRDHRGLISDFMVALLVAVKGAANTSVLLLEEILTKYATARQRSAKNPHRWKTNTFITTPDEIFALRFEKNGRPQRTLFFLEVDTGSEPQRRSRNSRRTQSELYRKLEGYFASWRAWSALAEEGQQTPFGFAGFRVLFVMQSKRRIHNTIEQNRCLVPGNLGSRLFMFATHEEVTREDRSVLDLPWINGRGERTGLQA